MNAAARIGAVLLVAGVLTACEGDAEGDLADATLPSGTMAIDRDAILNEVDDVRAFLADSASAFPEDAITDVNFEGSQLTVAVGPEVTGVEDAEAFCNDLAGSMQIADITVSVVDEAGAELAQCSFQA